MPDVGYWGTFFLQLASGIPTAVMLAALAFLSKSLIGNLFKKDLAQHKAELERDLQSNLLELRREHDAALAQLQVRFTRLHERRFDCVARIYEKLLGMLWTLERVSNPGAPPDENFRVEQLDAFYAHLDDMTSALSLNRILFPRSLADEARTLILDMTAIADSIRMDTQSAYDEYPNIGTVVKPKLNQLTDRFRQLLGVEREEEESRR